MAIPHGKDSVFTIDSVDLTSYLDNISFPRSVDTAETSTMGNSSKTYIEGMTDSTISISGKWDGTATTGPDDVLEGLTGSVTFEYGPDGDTATHVKYTGNCIKTAYNVTSPIGDVVAFTAEFQVTGDITRGTYSA